MRLKKKKRKSELLSPVRSHILFPRGNYYQEPPGDPSHGVLYMHWANVICWLTGQLFQTLFPCYHGWKARYFPSLPCSWGWAGETLPWTMRYGGKMAHAGKGGAR